MAGVAEDRRTSPLTSKADLAWRKQVHSVNN